MNRLGPITVDENKDLVCECGYIFKTGDYINIQEDKIICDSCAGEIEKSQT